MQRRAFVLAVSNASLAAAHHSINDFNWRKWETYSGRVTALEWTSPHCYVQVQVKGTALRFELDREFSMERKGVTREMLGPGREVSIRAYVHLTQANEKRAAILDLAEGSFKLMSLPEDDPFVGEWRLASPRAEGAAQRIRIWKVGEQMHCALDNQTASVLRGQRPGSHLLQLDAARHVIDDDQQTLTIIRGVDRAIVYRRHQGS